MKKKKLLSILVIASLLVFAGFSFGMSKVEAQDETYNIGVSLPSPQNQWVAGLTYYVEQVAQNSGENFNITVTSAGDPSTQVSDVNDLLTQDLDVLVLLPIESAPLTPIAQKAFTEQNIPVIIVDRDIRSNTYSTYIGGNNKGIGRAAAHYIGRKLDGEGKVVEIMGPPAEITDLRSQGFHDTIEEYYPDIEVIDQAAGDFQREKSLNVMQDILTSNSEIDAVYSHDDEQSLGIAAAIKAAGREDEMFVTGAGGNKQVFQRLMNEDDDNIITATFTYPPTMGGSAVNLAKKMAKQEGLPTLLEPTVPKDIILRASTVTAENADKFYNPDSKY